MMMQITWEVEDGYVGKSRPQHLIFNSDDYMDEDEWRRTSYKKKKILIEEAVQEDFESKITWNITSDIEET